MATLPWSLDPITSSMITSPSSTELQLFHKREIQLYNWIVRCIRKPPTIAKLVFCLWFCLQEVFSGLLENIHRCDANTLKVIFDETWSCLSYIEPHATCPKNQDENLALSRLVNRSITRRFFYSERDKISELIRHYNTTICDVIFDENVAMQVKIFDNYAGVPRKFGKGLCTKAKISRGADASRNLSSLDPNATPFDASKLPPPEERTMFVTFSHGYPLTKEEIKEFFAMKYGDVVENVMIPKAEAGIQPKYSLVTFYNIVTILFILNGEKMVKFVVNGKDLWARIFEPVP